MLTILDEEFAPITSTVVLINASLERIQAWETERERTRPEREKDRTERERSKPTTFTSLTGGLTDMLPRLEPLTSPITMRRLWVQTRNPEWSVYLAGSTRGTEYHAQGALHGYCHHLQVPGLEIASSPHTLRRDGTGRPGNMVFSLYDPAGEGTRVIAAQVGDGDRWVFTNVGKIRPFEQAEAYGNRRIRDRLTGEMIADYCAALGLFPFEKDFYGPRGLLMEQVPESYLPHFDPRELVQKSLAEVQAEAGISPGMPVEPPRRRSGPARPPSLPSPSRPPSALLPPATLLLGGRYAPTTEAIGFVQVDLETAARALVSWREEVHGAGTVVVEHLRGGLAPLLEQLDPLDVGPEAASELLVETHDGQWTALFDSSAADPAVSRAVGALAEQLGVTGVVAAWRPHPVGTEAEELDADGQYLDEDVLGGAGRTEFSVVGPEGGPPDLVVRQLRAEYAYDQWEFTDDGEYLDFEDPGAYAAARIPERLTPERVAAYCRAMGIDPFSASYYGLRAVLLHRPVDVLGRVPRRSLR